MAAAGDVVRALVAEKATIPPDVLYCARSWSRPHDASSLLPRWCISSWWSLSERDSSLLSIELHWVCERRMDWLVVEYWSRRLAWVGTDGSADRRGDAHRHAWL